MKHYFSAIAIMMLSMLSATVNSLAIPVTYTFSAKDGSGKVIDSKFADTKLYVTIDNYSEGLTFKVNGADAEYDSSTGIAIIENAKTYTTNTTYTVEVYRDENLVATKTYTFIPSCNVTGYKKLADGTEAVCTFANGNKITYVNSGGTEIYLEDASSGIQGYNLGLATTPTAYKTVSSGSIWGIKNTSSGIVRITAADSTRAFSSLTQTSTDVTPTSLDVAKTFLETNQLRYAKISNGKIVQKGSNFYAVAVSDSVMLKDSFGTGALTNLDHTPCYADVTGIISIDNEIVQVLPTSIQNVTDSLKGTSGTVSWSIDMDGNMEFYPENGDSGQLPSITNNAASQRSWSSFVAIIKTVKFQSGVQANPSSKYLFYTMTNLESVDFTNFDSSPITAAGNMFKGCSSIKTIDMSSLDLDKVTNLANTFDGCSALESVNFGSNTFANATDISYIFRNCSSIKAIDMSSLNLNNATKFGSAFEGCSALESVNFGSNTFAKATGMAKMFCNCGALKSLDFSNVTGAAVTDMTNMLSGCSNLKSVDFRNFSTAKITTAAKANVFDTALPDTMCLSKSFGKTKIDTVYVPLPKKSYMTPEGGKTFDLNVGGKQAELYTYNESLDSCGIYVPYEAKTFIFNESSVTKQVLTDALGTTANVTIKRTFYKDACDNTVCLPFSLDAAALGESPLAGYTKLQVFSSATVKNKGADNETVVLTMKDTTAIAAGKPFIIAWASGENIVNPTFTDVTVSVDEGECIKDATNNVSFCGALIPKAVTADDKNTLFMDGDGKLKWPSVSKNIKAFRCYITLDD